MGDALVAGDGTPLLSTDAVALKDATKSSARPSQSPAPTRFRKKYHRPRRPNRGSAPAARPVNLRSRLLAVDVVSLSAAYLVVAFSGFRTSALIVAASGVAWLITGLILIAAGRLYLARVSAVRSTELTRLAPALLGAAVGSASVMSFSTGDVWIGRFVVLWLVGFVIATFGRSAFDGWLRRERAEGRFMRPIVIVGTGGDALELEDLLRQHPEFGFAPAGFVGPGPLEGNHAPWFGGLEELDYALKETHSNGVLLAADGRDGQKKRRLVGSLADSGVHVHLSGGLWGVAHRRLRPMPIAHEPLFYVEAPRLGRVQQAAKRAIDIVLCIVGLVVVSPVILVTALAIKLSDRGPVFYRQERIGRGGDPFTMIKFRSMRVGADAESRPSNSRSGPLYKSNGHDPRVTRIGRFLRITSIDEFPQFINVIRGEMSLVGPRPALPDEVEQFDGELLERHNVRPGVTGLWQVEARDNESFEAYRRLDLFYIENWSPVLDMVIMQLTLQRVIERSLRMFRGVRGGE